MNVTLLGLVAAVSVVVAILVFVAIVATARLSGRRAARPFEHAIDLVNAARSISISAYSSLGELAPGLKLMITTEQQRDVYERRVLAACIGVGLMHVAQKLESPAREQQETLVRDDLARRYPSAPPLVDEFLAAPVAAGARPDPRTVGAWVIEGVPTVNAQSAGSLTADDTCFRVGLLINSVRAVLEQ